MTRRIWTEDKIERALLSRLSSGKDMSDQAIRNDDLPLCHAYHRYLGGWHKAMKKIGVDPSALERQHPRGYWSEDPQGRIIEEIRRIAASEGITALSARSIYLTHGEVYDAALKYFPRGWQEAVTKAGYDYKSIRKQREPYTKSELVETLRRLHADGLPLDWSSVRNYDANLAAAVVSRFGKYENFIKELGLDYETIRRDWDTEKRKGELFELLVLKVLLTLGDRIEYQKRFKYRNEACVVDFFNIDTGEWFDAKLNSWTPEIVESIRKYLRHKDRLTIIYLKESRRRKTHWAGDRVRFIPVRDYYPRLLNCGVKDLVLRIERLRRLRADRGVLWKLLETTYSEVEPEIELPLTEVSIIARLRELKNRGEDIGPDNLPVRFRQAGIDLFGGTWEMYEAADVNPRQFFKRQKYTKNRMISIVRELHSSGEDVRMKRLQKMYPGFRDACKRLFITPVALYRAAEVPSPERTKWHRWSKEEVIEVLTTLRKAGEDLRPSALKARHPSLYQCGRRAFGSTEAMYAAAGIPTEEYEKETPPRFWRKDTIIATLKELNAKGEDIRPKALLKNYAGLLDAARGRVFKNSREMYLAAGFDPVVDLGMSRIWKRDTIISTLKERDDNGLSNKAVTLQKELPGLLNAGYEIFGSHPEMLKAAGVLKEKTKKLL